MEDKYVENIIEDIKNKLPKEEDNYALAEFFKVFGDYTRTKIMLTLEYKELCVFEIASILDMTTSAVSHQLRVLRNNKLVKARKRGKEVFYSLDDEHVNQILKCGLNHIRE